MTHILRSPSCRRRLSLLFFQKMEHELTSDSEAEEETLAVIKYTNDSLPTTLKRHRKHCPVTRAESSTVISKYKNIDATMKNIFMQFGKLCTMIEEAGGHVPDSLVQDMHEQVFESLAQNLVKQA